MYIYSIKQYNLGNCNLKLRILWNYIVSILKFQDTSDYWSYDKAYRVCMIYSICRDDQYRQRPWRSLMKEDKDMNKMSLE